MARIKNLGNLELEICQPANSPTEEPRTLVSFILELDVPIEGIGQLARPLSKEEMAAHSCGLPYTLKAQVLVLPDGQYRCMGGEPWVVGASERFRELLPRPMVALFRRLAVHMKEGGEFMDDVEDYPCGIEISPLEPCCDRKLSFGPDDLIKPVRYPSKYLDSTARKLGRWWKAINDSESGLSVMQSRLLSDN